MKNGHHEKPYDEQKFQKLVNEMADKGKALLNEGLENAKEILSEQTQSLKEKAEEYGLDGAAEGVRSYVERHPLRAVGIALAVGVILGRILSPSHSESIES